MNNFTFSTPRICDHKGDLSKPWYVYFNAEYHKTGEKKQFRYKLGINRVKGKRERMNSAKTALSTINKLLIDDGWNPFTAKFEKPQTGLMYVLQRALDLKMLTVRLRTRQCYSSTLSIFIDWCKSQGCEAIEPSKFNRQNALAFKDYLLIEKRVAGKTCNNMVGYMKTLFFMLKDRDVIIENPFCRIGKCLEDEGKNVAFTKTEINKVLNYLKLRDIRLYYATQFVRFGFIRKTELQALKVRNINLITHTITIPAHISKNRKSDFVTIPKSLEAIIREMGLDEANPDHYIFGKGLETCETRLRRTATLSDRHRDAISKLKLRHELIFYGWKHTGCVELYNIVKDPYVVCRQCRHSDVLRVFPEN